MTPAAVTAVELARLVEQRGAAHLSPAQARLVLEDFEARGLVEAEADQWRLSRAGARVAGGLVAAADERAEP